MLVFLSFETCFPYFFDPDAARVLLAPPLFEFPFLAALALPAVLVPALDVPRLAPVVRLGVVVDVADLLPVPVVRAFLLGAFEDRDFLVRLRPSVPEDPRTAAAAASRCFCCCASMSL